MDMVGTTRSRVNMFMNKFRKLGFIHYNGGLQVHSSLLSVFLYEQLMHIYSNKARCLPRSVLDRRLNYAILI